MHESIAADHYRIYNAFVRRYFPATSTPALWKDAAQALASRTRALDRRAVQARYLKVPPHILRQSSNDRNRRADRPTLGFRPPIDSYETLRSNNWLDRKEVLAYGAGADLIVRVRNNEHHLSRGTEWEKSHRKTDKSAWILHSNPGLAGSWHDITGIHLLPQLDTSAAYEEVIFARRSGDVQRAVLSPSGEVTVKQCFDIGDKERVEKTDLSLEGGRVLAVTLEKGPTKLFNVDGTSETEKVQPFASIGPQAISVGGSPRNRVSKLLSASRIALWSHHDGKSIELCDVTESGVREARNFDGQRENKNVYDFTPLEANARTGCAVGDLFLSGWQDGVVR
ncbi:hypothetical protein KEM55_008378 [Ascosphaera atra]|nr:hypothetical protein KEM55_008378 [Ascosphaera atra]